MLPVLLVIMLVSITTKRPEPADRPPSTADGRLPPPGPPPSIIIMLQNHSVFATHWNESYFHAYHCTFLIAYNWIFLHIWFLILMHLNTHTDIYTSMHVYAYKIRLYFMHRLLRHTLEQFGDDKFCESVEAWFKALKKPDKGSLSVTSQL